MKSLHLDMKTKRLAVPVGVLPLLQGARSRAPSGRDVLSVCTDPLFAGTIPWAPTIQGGVREVVPGSRHLKIHLRPHQNGEKAMKKHLKSQALRPHVFGV